MQEVKWINALAFLVKHISTLAFLVAWIFGIYWWGAFFIAILCLGIDLISDYERGRFCSWASDKLRREKESRAFVYGQIGLAGAINVFAATVATAFMAVRLGVSGSIIASFAITMVATMLYQLGVFGDFNQFCKKPWGDAVLSYVQQVVAIAGVVMMVLRNLP